MRADEGALPGQFAAEIERDVAQRRRQEAARRAARQVGLEDVALLHAATMAVDQLTHRDAGRRQLDARLLHSPRHRPGAGTRMPRLAERGETGGPLLHDVAPPPNRLDRVVDSRRTE